MFCFFFFQAEDGIRDLVRSRGLGDVYKRQVVIIAASFFITSCNQPAPATEKTEKKGTVEEVAKPEFYLYRPDLEKAYGYSHAVKIGNVIKISGAVSLSLIHISEPTRPY